MQLPFSLILGKCCSTHDSTQHKTREETDKHFVQNSSAFNLLTSLLSPHSLTCSLYFSTFFITTPCVFFFNLSYYYSYFRNDCDDLTKKRKMNALHFTTTNRNWTNLQKTAWKKVNGSMMKIAVDWRNFHIFY